MRCFSDKHPVSPWMLSARCARISSNWSSPLPRPRGQRMSSTFTQKHLPLSVHLSVRRRTPPRVDSRSSDRRVSNNAVTTDVTVEKKNYTTTTTAMAKDFFLEGKTPDVGDNLILFVHKKNQDGYFHALRILKRSLFFHSGLDLKIAHVTQTQSGGDMDAANAECSRVFVL